MTPGEKYLEDIPYEHQLPFAVFTCIQEGIDAYSGLMIFKYRFGAVQWFAEFAKQEKEK